MPRAIFSSLSPAQSYFPSEGGRMKETSPRWGRWWKWTVPCVLKVHWLNSRVNLPRALCSIVADRSDLYQVALVISDGGKSKEKDDGCREAEFPFLWRMFGSHNLKHTLLSVMKNGHCVLPPSVLLPSTLTNAAACAFLMLMSLFLPQGSG